MEFRPRGLPRVAKSGPIQILMLAGELIAAKEHEKDRRLVAGGKQKRLVIRTSQQTGRALSRGEKHSKMNLDELRKMAV